MASVAVDRLRNVLRKSPFSEHSKRKTFFKRLNPLVSALKYNIMAFKYEAKRVDWTYLMDATRHNLWEFTQKQENLRGMIDQIMVDLGNIISMVPMDRRGQFENMLTEIRTYKTTLMAAMDERNVQDLRRLGDFEGVETDSEALVFNLVLSALDELMSWSPR